MLGKQLIVLAVLSLTLAALAANVKHDKNVATAGLNCTANFTLVGNQCLRLVNSYVNWFQADRICRSMGANLISLQNVMQWRQLNKWLNAVGPNGYAYWTSGNSLGQPGHYYWQDSGEEAQYLPWAVMQPTLNQGNCIMIFAVQPDNMGSEYPLVLDFCLETTPLICEMSPISVAK